MQAIASQGTSPALSPRRNDRRLPGVREAKIVGCYRAISVHQLCMAWWLYAEGHMTRRCLRTWFAAHEMAERRRHSGTRGNFSMAELQRLIGSKESATAKAALSGDVRRLSRLGLVKIGRHRIEFARSIEELQAGDTTEFTQLIGQMPHPRRIVPVPRRTLRALAAGFGRGVTAVMIAMMIRSLFWHEGKATPYRVDGRTKGSWITKVFGISRRAVTDARIRLTELGWMEPMTSRQWELNRWGAHDRINTAWHPGIVEKAVGENATGRDECASATPAHQDETANPSLNRSPSSVEEDVITRKPGRSRTRLGSKEIAADDPNRPAVSLRNIRPEDLADTGAVLELYSQAREAGLAVSGERGELEFVALVERARCRGRRPGALLAWLLREHRREFITLSDEDGAVERLREYRRAAALRN